MVSEGSNWDKIQLPPYKVDHVISTMSQTQGWGIKDMNIPSVWSNTQGENVVIAVIDTGMSDHPDLGDNVTTGENFIPYENDMDMNGHQTHCVGIICAQNNDMGMVGVAPKSKVVCIKALDKNGSGSYMGITQALEYCADILKPDIVSMSLGGTQPFSPMHEQIKRLYDMNIPVICAAGNSGAGGVNYPAKYPETISVAAYDKNGNVAGFSSKGEEVDWAAPGVDIYSTFLEGRYARMSGTSMACPFMAGVVALMISNWKKTSNTRRSIPSIIEELLHHTKDRGVIGPDNSWGYGVVDVPELIDDDPFTPEFPDKPDETPEEDNPFTPEFPDKPDETPVTPPREEQPVSPIPLKPPPIWKRKRTWITVAIAIASAIGIWLLAQHHNKQEHLDSVDWDEKFYQDLRDRNMTINDWYQSRR